MAELLSEVVHVVHAVLAGIWLGGVVFTMSVVSPALKALEWDEAERVLVRSRIGKQYARIGGANLTLLLLFAVLDGILAGFGVVFYVEYLSIAVLFGLVAAHGVLFGRRLERFASLEKSAAQEGEARALAARRRKLQRTSLWVSRTNLLLSLAVASLAVAD